MIIKYVAKSLCKQIIITESISLNSVISAEVISTSFSLAASSPGATPAYYLHLIYVKQILYLMIMSVDI